MGKVNGVIKVIFLISIFVLSGCASQNMTFSPESINSMHKYQRDTKFRLLANYIKNEDNLSGSFTLVFYPKNDYHNLVSGLFTCSPNKELIYVYTNDEQKKKIGPNPLIFHLCTHPGESLEYMWVLKSGLLF